MGLAGKRYRLRVSCWRFLLEANPGEWAARGRRKRSVRHRGFPARPSSPCTAGHLVPRLVSVDWVRTVHLMMWHTR